MKHGSLAVELYREGRLTLKQAAGLAGLCVEDFMRELEEELRVAEHVAREARS